MAGRFNWILGPEGWNKLWGLLVSSVPGLEPPKEQPATFPCGVWVEIVPGNSAKPALFYSLLYPVDAFYLLQLMQGLQAPPVTSQMEYLAQATVDEGQEHMNRELSASHTALTYLLIEKCKLFTRDEFFAQLMQTKREYDEEITARRDATDARPQRANPDPPAADGSGSPSGPSA